MSAIHREQTATVRGHSSRCWEKSPGIYENNRQASIENKLRLSRDIAVDIGKRVLLFDKRQASIENKLRLSRGIAVDVWKTVLAFYFITPGINREQTATVRGHSSRCWKKSPCIYENKCQASIENKLRLSRDIAVDTGKRVLVFILINARHISRTNCDCLLLCPLTVAVCSRWMPGVYENKHQDSFSNIYCYVPWQSKSVLDGCLAFMKINTRTLSQRLLLSPLTVAVCSWWMLGIYFHKCQDSFLTVYCYVPWQSQFVLDGCLAFIFINTRTLFPTSNAISLDSRTLFSMDAFHLFSEMPGLFSQHLRLCTLAVAVCSRWMPFVYENKHQDSFPNVYCYVPWQSQFCSWLMLAIYFHKCQDSFPNIYCFVIWQSQFVLDGCLAFMKINARTLFRTSTAMALDSRSFFSIDAWRLWK